MRRFAYPLLLGLCAFLGGAAAAELSSWGLSRAFAQASGPATPTPGNELTRLGERFEMR